MHNGQGFVAGVALVFRPPTAAADLPAGRQVENIKLKLRTKVQSCFQPEPQPGFVTCQPLSRLADVCQATHKSCYVAFFLLLFQPIQNIVCYFLPFWFSAYEVPTIFELFKFFDAISVFVCIEIFSVQRCWNAMVFLSCNKK